MPDHPRKFIRKATAAQLMGNTAAAARVFTTRMIPYQRTELPALAVYTLQEDVNADESTAPRELTRQIQLAIEGAVQADENVDDTLDDFALEIETAIHADDTLGNTAADCLLSSTEMSVFEEKAKTVGLIRLVYVVTYYTYAPAEASGLDDFKRADIHHNLANAQPVADQAHDLVETEE